VKHPSETLLALYAGGECGLLQRLRVRLHLRSCESCRAEVESFGDSRDWFQAAASEVPNNVDWERLSGEMRANIHVGLAAGEAVASPAPERHPLGWRAAAALASVAVVVIGGWWLHIPHTANAPDDVVLAATPAGIELKDEGGALTMLHSDAEMAVVSVSAEGSMTARFVDEETGQVTINHVYVE